MINAKCRMCDKKATIYITIKSEKIPSCECCYNIYKKVMKKCNVKV